MEAKAFLDRVFQRVSSGTVSTYDFKSWKHAGNPTSEGIGLLPASGIDPEKFIARVMDVDHYVGNIDHVVESRSIEDERFPRPQNVRFYQRINVPMLATIHQELVLVDGGEMQGFRVAYWYMLDKETGALSPKVGARGDYNVGAWLVNANTVGYALSSAPRKSDVGFLKYKALTKGADAAASTVVKNNIAGMIRWAKRT